MTKVSARTADAANAVNAIKANLVSIGDIQWNGAHHRLPSARKQLRRG
jgi:hypothetical protein